VFRFWYQCGDSGEGEHLIPKWIEQSKSSNTVESQYVDIMLSTLWNEVLSPSWNGMLTLPRFEVNATGISRHTAYSCE